MCIILIGKITKEQHKAALAQNGDGFSLFNDEMGLVKCPTEEQVKKAIGKWGIWHYRIATSGRVDEYNVHPFPVCGGKYLLYHNGVLGDGLGDMSDTHALAETLMHVPYKTARAVIESLTTGNRFVLARADNPHYFEVFGEWKVSAGVLMSHAMYCSPATSRSVGQYKTPKPWRNDNLFTLGGK